MLHLAFLMPLLPLAGFAVLVTFGRRLGNPFAGWLGTATVTGSFVIAVIVFIGLLHRTGDARSFTQVLFTWIPAGSFHARAALLIDPLSMTMALFVTGVSALIHLYSIGYMSHDKDYPRFFVYLNLFVASMLVLVLANNLLFSFVGWEGVGLCSYLLIAFWFDRDTATTAGKKAFIFNRIGDTGFLLAVFLLFGSIHTFTFSGPHGIFAHAGSMSTGLATAVSLLIFLAATGKSAQVPLFTWLPDAMEGPTPVSALIHAATMVTAGVYLMVRMSPVLHRSPDALLVVAGVGVATAFIAATIGATQNDIKKVLAYSTVSQLGYMFLAVGTQAYVAAIFLMISHAFYKGLLFLSAGSVIHGLGDEQDIKKMGGLRKYMPLTYGAFFVAWLAISGVPPFSGFWAKGDVLMNAFADNRALWAVGLITAVLTAYYMSREIALVFYGDERWRRLRVIKGEPHESPWVMVVPLMILAFCAAFGGLLNLPFHPNWVVLDHWLQPVLGSVVRVPHVGIGGEWALALGDAVAAFLGLGVALGWWVGRSERPALEPAFLRRAWFYDAAIDRLISRPSTAASLVAATDVEERTIDGGVTAVATLVRATGDRLRRIQTGFVRNYALAIAVGAVGILAWMLTRASL